MFFVTISTFKNHHTNSFTIYSSKSFPTTTCITRTDFLLFVSCCFINHSPFICFICKSITCYCHLSVSKFLFSSLTVSRFSQFFITSGDLVPFLLHYLLATAKFETKMLVSGYGSTDLYCPPYREVWPWYYWTSLKKFQIDRL